MGKRGAPRGNQNARKHGFYAKVLSEAERLELEEAAGVEGIDAEIALLRVKIQEILEHDPDNVQLLMQAARTLERMVRTRHNISSQEKKSLKEAITTVLQEVALPLGLKFLP
jgi:hypothetical protein